MNTTTIKVNIKGEQKERNLCQRLLRFFAPKALLWQARRERPHFARQQRAELERAFHVTVTQTVREELATIALEHGRCAHLV